MSSESDDDFSYTNTASVLKSLKKKDLSISEDNDTSVDCALTFTDSPIISKNIKRKKNAKSKDSLIVIEKEVNNEVADNIKVMEDRNENTDCIAVSDDEADKSLNIVSMIDSYLQKGKRKRGRKPAKKNNTKTPNKSRRSKRFTKNSPTVSSFSVAKVYVVSDTEESNNTDTEVNFDVTVKVWWKSQYIEKFTIRRFEKIDAIFKHFAEKENVSEDRLLFTIHEKILMKSDTPDSLNVNAASIIEGGVLSEEKQITTTVRPTHADRIELKVQLKDRKHPLKIYLRLTDGMNILMYQCAEELKVPSNTLKFYFDGDLIKQNDTAESLQLEGGECIDCVRK
ncbi:Rad60 [Carabus blaptoides fortunei]